MANTPETRVADSTLEVSDSRSARTEPSFLLHWIEFTYAFPSSLTRIDLRLPAIHTRINRVFRKNLLVEEDLPGLLVLYFNY
jgi:hypothetical protein